jgi:hypothetical protein
MAGLDGWVNTRPPPGADPRTAQAVASCYTNYAIPALNNNNNEEDDKNNNNNNNNFLTLAGQPLVDQDLLTVEASRPH